MLFVTRAQSFPEIKFKKYILYFLEKSFLLSLLRRRCEHNFFFRVFVFCSFNFPVLFLSQKILCLIFSTSFALKVFSFENCFLLLLWIGSSIAAIFHLFFNTKNESFQNSVLLLFSLKNSEFDVVKKSFSSSFP